MTSRNMSTVSLLSNTTATTRSSSCSSNTTENYDEEINAKRYLLGSYHDRRIPQGKSSALGAIFVVTNAAMGAGMLSFPYAFYLAGGWYWGLTVEMVSYCVYQIKAGPYETTTMCLFRSSLI